MLDAVVAVRISGRSVIRYFTDEGEACLLGYSLGCDIAEHRGEGDRPKPKAIKSPSGNDHERSCSDSSVSPPLRDPVTSFWRSVIGEDQAYCTEEALFFLPDDGEGGDFTSFP